MIPGEEEVSQIKLLIDVEAQKDEYTPYDLMEVIKVNLYKGDSEQEFNYPDNSIGQMMTMVSGILDKKLTKQQKLDVLRKYGIKVDQEMEGEVGQMCSYTASVLRDGMEQGRAKEIISMGLEDGLTKDKIISRLVSRLEIEQEQAEEYYSKFSKEMK